MANKVLGFFMVVAVAGVALGSLWLSTPGDADASEHSATRSFSSSSVAPGEEITVAITVTNVEEMGEVTLWAGMDALTMAPQVSDTITGAVMDPDGGVMGESWQWSRTMDAADMNSWMPTPRLRCSA